ncbi:hypothetical protein [Deinococcus sp.]|uniref:hypothetical protein n=1 Tax=Deinococcus sp. TaxID=47478 RepID=UPI0025FC1170|nr:hypothetical protein [Deinococcus sp.]
MNPVIRLALPLLPLLLSACGWISLPEQRVSDFSFTVSGLNLTPGQVAYLPYNQLEGVRLPPALLPYNGVSGGADLTYRGQTPELRLELFGASFRPVCPLVMVAGVGVSLVCDGPAGGQVLSELTLHPGESTRLRLGGPDQAVRGGALYLGVRLLEGQFRPGERVDVTGGVLGARL